MGRIGYSTCLKVQAAPRCPLSSCWLSGMCSIEESQGQVYGSNEKDEYVPDAVIHLADGSAKKL